MAEEKKYFKWTEASEKFPPVDKVVIVEYSMANGMIIVHEMARSSTRRVGNVANYKWLEEVDYSFYNPNYVKKQ